MELQEQINALNAEKTHLSGLLESTNAEKVALDQLLVESLKSSVSTKKDLFLSQAKINTLLQEINILKSQKEELQKSVDGLTHDIHLLASHAQSSEG